MNRVMLYFKLRLIEMSKKDLQTTLYNQDLSLQNLKQELIDHQSQADKVILELHSEKTFTCSKYEDEIASLEKESEVLRALLVDKTLHIDKLIHG